MRVISSIEFDGIEYQTIWASLAWIKDDRAGRGSGKALTVRSSDGTNQVIVHRNAKLADVEAALRRLRGLGLPDSHVGKLFNYKGDAKGLAQHVKVLVSSLN
jgi:hypothetical protein